MFNLNSHLKVNLWRKLQLPLPEYWNLKLSKQTKSFQWIFDMNVSTSPWSLFYNIICSVGKTFSRCCGRIEHTRKFALCLFSRFRLQILINFLLKMKNMELYKNFIIQIFISTSLKLKATKTLYPVDFCQKIPENCWIWWVCAYSWCLFPPYTIWRGWGKLNDKYP